MRNKEKVQFENILQTMERSPLKTICLECCAIYPKYEQNKEFGWLVDKNKNRVDAVCRVCNTKYASHSTHDASQFTEASYEIGLGKDRAYSKLIAEIAVGFFPYIHFDVFRQKKHYAPDLIFRAIREARYFVHFLTRSIDTTTLNSFQNTKAHVRGFISSTAGINNLSLLNHINQGNWHRGLGFYERLHTKLLIIDGVIAFRGSANLSEPAWRRAFGSHPNDIIEVTVSPEEIAKLNNLYFAPHWLDGQSFIKKRF